MKPFHFLSVLVSNLSIRPWDFPLLSVWAGAMKPIRQPSFLLAVTAISLTSVATAQVPPVDAAKQGFSMRVEHNNVGTFGHIAYPPFNPGNPGGAPLDSIGIEYPIGSSIQHVWGAGVWVGGILDTARQGTSTPVKLVTVAYEGWTGPYYEFFPGSGPADTIWKTNGRNDPKPADWDAYWGSDLSYNPISDNDHHCAYTDTAVQVSQHVPLRLKVVQSSCVWSDSLGEGIHIIEYRLFNTGTKAIDSLHIGMFVEPEPTRYYLSYLADDHVAVLGMPWDSVVSLLGVGIVGASIPLDSLFASLIWFQGPNSPRSDAAKFSAMSSHSIAPDEYPPPPDRRFIFAVGPFNLPPGGAGDSGRVVVAFAVLCANDALSLYQRVVIARELYDNGGVLSVSSEREGLPVQGGLSQNYPNPFNPTTSIKVKVPSSKVVTLKVYDVLGREVATLLNEEKSAGAYTVQWDASGVSSGVYFYRIKAGDFVQTKRMMVVR